MKETTYLGLWIIALTAIGLTGWGSYTVYMNYNYVLTRATKYAYTAENTLDRSLIADRLQLCLDTLAPLEGNYAWWFPTDETNITSIKITLQSLIETCRSTENMTDWQLTNIHNTIENIIYDLESAEDGIVPKYATFLIWLWIFNAIYVIIIIILKDFVD